MCLAGPGSGEEAGRGDPVSKRQRGGEGAREQGRKGPRGEMFIAFQGRGPGPRRASDLFCSLLLSSSLTALAI